MIIKKSKLFNYLSFAVIILVGVLNMFFGSLSLEKPLLVLFSLFLAYILFFQKPVLQIKAILLCLFMPSEYLGFVIFLLVAAKIIFQKRFKKSTCLNLILLFFGYAFFIYTLSNIFIEINLLSLPFWAVTFFSHLLIFIYIYQMVISKEERLEIFNYLKLIIWAQIVPILFFMVINSAFKPSDSFKGSLYNAHYLGFMFILLLLFHIARAVENWKDILNFKYAAVGLIILSIIFLADAKGILLCFAVALFLYILVRNIGLFFFGAINKYIKKREVVYSVLFVICLLFFSNITNMVYFYGKYILRKSISYTKVIEKRGIFPEESHKAIFYKRVFKELPKKYSSLLGTGPGTLGSRAANSRAYDTLAKKEGEKVPGFIKPFTSRPANKFLVDLYQEDFAHTASSRSAMLTWPFSGYATILGELGYIGLAIFLLIPVYLIYLLFKKEQRKDTAVEIKEYSLGLQILIVIFLVMLVFDNFQERPIVVYTTYVLAAVLIAPDKKIKSY
jgi:hypothetical protein